MDWHPLAHRGQVQGVHVCNRNALFRPVPQLRNDLSLRAGESLQRFTGQARTGHLPPLFNGLAHGSMTRLWPQDSRLSLCRPPWAEAIT